MAHSPVWKVYDQDGQYQASAKDAFIAAGIIGSVGTDGWTIRYGHSFIAWREGVETIHAAESFDTVSRVCQERVQANRERRP